MSQLYFLSAERLKLTASRPNEAIRLQQNPNVAAMRWRTLLGGGASYGFLAKIDARRL